MLLCDALVRRLCTIRSSIAARRRRCAAFLQLAVQAVGVVLILLVIFGTPQETPTILGLATAALTIALQDYILAFLGWFVLMGKNGIRVGDWVEINGVGGEVTEVGLFTTTLLETGTLEDKGHPTGRRITFMNGFAIRGQYFNFSTSRPVDVGRNQRHDSCIGRCADDCGADPHDRARRRRKRMPASQSRSGSAARAGTASSRFSAAPVVNLRPSGPGIDTEVRYVTRASERFEVRNRLYQRIVELLQRQGKPERAAEVHAQTQAKLTLAPKVTG